MFSVNKANHMAKSKTDYCQYFLIKNSRKLGIFLSMATWPYSTMQCYLANKALVVCLLRLNCNDRDKGHTIWWEQHLANNFCSPCRRGGGGYVWKSTSFISTNHTYSLFSNNALLRKIHHRKFQSCPNKAFLT